MKRILIVDDSPTICGMIKMALTPIQTKPFIAEDAAQALKILP